MSSLIIAAIILPIVAGLLLQIGAVQNYAVRKLTGWLSEKTQTTISIRHVDIAFFNRATVEGFFVGDPNGNPARDTLLYVDSIRTNVSVLNFFTGELSLGTVSLSGAVMHLGKDSTGTMNIKRVLDHLKAKEPREQGDFRIKAAELDIRNMRFTYRVAGVPERNHGVNFKDLDLTGLNLHVHDIRVDNYDVRCTFENLSFTEKGGFRLDRLQSARVEVNEKGLKFDDLLLVTPDSRLDAGHLYLLYDSWRDYKDFVNKVAFDASFRRSHLSYPTLSAFMKRPSDMVPAIWFEGTVEGPVSDLHGRLVNVNTADHTSLTAAFRITGLPAVASTRFVFNLEELATDAADISALYRDVTGKAFAQTALLEQCGRIGFRGVFDGMLKNFTASGTLSTNQGAVRGRLRFLPSGSGSHFVGSLATAGFRPGVLAGIQGLGAVSFEADVNAFARGRDLTVSTTADISQLEYRGYTYRDIAIDGDFAGRTFTGHIHSRDTNFTASIDGRFDLTQAVPAYDFDMTLDRADFYALHFAKDTVSQLAGRLRAHATGNTLDNLNGDLTIDSLYYVSLTDTVRVGAINVFARNTETSKFMSINSHFADIELHGKNSYSSMFRFLGESVQHYLPDIPPLDASVPDAAAKRRKTRKPKPSEDPVPYPDGQYRITVNVKEANNVAAIFLPGLEVAKGSNLTFLFNPHEDSFSLNANSDYILTNNLYVESLFVTGRNHADSVGMFVSSKRFGVGNTDLPNLSVQLGLRKNRVTLSARFADSTRRTGAIVSTTTTIGKTPEGAARFDTELHPGAFELEGRRWLIDASRIVYSKDRIEVWDFRISSGQQSFAASGLSTRSDSDTLRVAIRGFDISPLSRFAGNTGYKPEGYLSGDIDVVAPLGEFQFTADLSLDSLGFNGHPLGHVDLESDWDRANKAVRFSAIAPDGSRPVKGFYSNLQKRYRVTFDFPHFDMAFLEPLLKGILVNTRGEADTHLVLSGEGPRLSLDGTIDVKNYTATVGYTNVTYSLAGPVKVTNNRFELSPAVPITDGIGGIGRISAWLDSESFKKLRFGITANFTEMLSLNTTLEQNPLFYGRAFGTGNITINGNERATVLDIRAETAGNSTFVLPLDEASSFSNAGFITFVDRSAKPPAESRVDVFRRERNVQRQRLSSETQIKLNLGVHPNTEARIVMDPRLGDEIKGRGNGRLIIDVIPARDIFNMEGLFTISEGTYLFTMFGVINKYFTIDPGGTINWTGDPVNPVVDLTAAYKVNASLKPLYASATGDADNNAGNVTARCILNLSDRLLSPTIKFDVTVPGTTPEVQNMVRNLLNTEEARRTQFVSLMVTNGFNPDMNAMNTVGGSMATVAGMEFLSNQISNLISTNKTNLRFGYRPQTEMASEEVTFDVGTTIIPNKLSFEVGGSYDVSGGQNNTKANSNPLAIDGALTLQLNKSGSLKLKGFTRTIESFDESQGLQDSGVGVYWTQDFRNLADLKTKYKAWTEDRRKNKQIRKEKRALKRENKKAAAE